MDAKAIGNRAGELAQDVRDGIWTRGEATISLAGFILKGWDEVGFEPVTVGDIRDVAYMNARAAMSLELD